MDSQTLQSLCWTTMEINTATLLWARVRKQSFHHSHELLHDMESSSFTLTTFFNPHESWIPSGTVGYNFKRWEDGCWMMGGCWTMISIFHVCWPQGELRMLWYHQVGETKWLGCKKDRLYLLLCKDTVHWNLVLYVVRALLYV